MTALTAKAALVDPAALGEGGVIATSIPRTEVEEALATGTTSELFLDVARERRPAVRRDVDLARGPARLCAALGIDRSVYGADLLGDGPVRLRPPVCGRTWSTYAAASVPASS